MSYWTDERVLSIVEQMEKEFGDKLPNPIHYPTQYKHYIRMFLFLNTQRKRAEEQNERRG